jgi:hypothetical protein
MLAQGETGSTTLQWIDDGINASLGSNTAGVIVNSPAGSTPGTVQIVTGAIGSQNTWEFGADGRTKIQHGSNNPSTARGEPGDKAGMILVAGAYLFYCYADYTDGTVPIWQKTSMDNTDWD